MTGTCCRVCLPASCLAVLGLFLLAGDPPPASATKKADQTDPRWLAPLEEPDRACLEEMIGYAPPAFTSDLRWPRGEPMTWESLRGKVVVVQSWTCKTPAGRKAPARTAKVLGKHDANDLQLIALHTPEGLGSIERFLGLSKLDVPVAIDPTGAFCDQLGIYEEPVTIVVDRNGVVRYTGLSTRGLTQAVASLVQTPFDPLAKPASRPRQQLDYPAFPTFRGSVGRALDVRGKPAPQFAVEHWITERPNAAGKVLLVDFWATWCPPCRRSIPHVNELADRFRDEVCVIGVSNETPAKFQAGLRRYRLDPKGFRYSLALDPAARMQRAIRAQTIPHALVIDSEGIVRWQGYPPTLTAKILGQIVAADQARNGSLTCERWAARSG